MTADLDLERTSVAPENRLLVLGSTGKLGTLLQAASQRDPSVLGPWQPIWAGRSPGKKVDLVLDTATSLDSVPKAGAVLALWGTVPGKGDLAENAILAEQAVEVAQAIGATRVLHCSSSAVYGPAQNASETGPATPVNDYGVAKIEMEQRLTHLNLRDGVPYSVTLRLANVVGADSLFGAVKSGRPVTLDSMAVGVSPVRSYATTSVIWRAVTSLLACPQPPAIVNVAASNSVSMHSLLNAAHHPFSWRPAPETTVGEVSMNVDLLCQLTGQSLVVSPEDMIADWRKLHEDMV